MELLNHLWETDIRTCSVSRAGGRIAGGECSHYIVLITVGVHTFLGCTIGIY